MCSKKVDKNRERKYGSETEKVRNGYKKYSQKVEKKSSDKLSEEVERVQRESSTKKQKREI